ncbi:MAG: hypothetical protein AMJ46_12695 [Latescibacteria bacterium DG_63]|nr:MAG: hypothetical protein AMJ46_12695 [Latescibacteria bacterium DG_63]
MIWLWIVGGVGAVLAAIAVWTNRRWRLRGLVESAIELARVKSDLEVRRKYNKDRYGRHRQDAAAGIRRREEELLEETQDAECADLVDRINHR